MLCRLPSTACRLAGSAANAVQLAAPAASATRGFARTSEAVPPRESRAALPPRGVSDPKKEIRDVMEKMRARKDVKSEDAARAKDPMDKYRFRLKMDDGHHQGMRFPTLDTAENFEYHKDRGLDRVAHERAYPITVPGYRRMSPYLREYIYFLHTVDPARFTVERIAERYRLREATVNKVVQEWGVNLYLTRSGLTKLKNKQRTREAVVLQKKEEHYARWVGWDELGDAEEPESDDEALGQFKGWRSTSDWIRRQTVEVEAMSAYPLPEKNDPMPKRVDVDLVVDSSRDFKVINWIDPTDKVVF